MRLYLIDGNSLLYRAHYALREPMTNDKGFPTGALYGFTSMLLRLMDDTNPSHMVVVFDTPAPTFRHEMWPEYKANRTKKPSEDLTRQQPIVVEMIKHLGVSVLAIKGVEADDVIGTLVRKHEADIPITVVSSDKDLMQLVGKDVIMLDTKVRKVYRSDDVEVKLGVRPEKVVEALALAGDTSDNIPGVPGIGMKTATSLLKEFGDLENVLSSAADGRVSGKKRCENLVAYADQARLSRDLVQLKCDVNVDLALDDMQVDERNVEALTELFSAMGFKSLKRRIAPPKQQSLSSKWRK